MKMTAHLRNLKKGKDIILEMSKEQIKIKKENKKFISLSQQKMMSKNKIKMTALPK
jgi:hypothetical protein